MPKLGGLGNDDAQTSVCVWATCTPTAARALGCCLLASRHCYSMFLTHDGPRAQGGRHRPKHAFCTRRLVFGKQWQRRHQAARALLGAGGAGHSRSRRRLLSSTRKRRRQSSGADTNAYMQPATCLQRPAAARGSLGLGSGSTACGRSYCCTGPTRRSPSLPYTRCGAPRDTVVSRPPSPPRSHVPMP